MYSNKDKEPEGNIIYGYLAGILMVAISFTIKNLSNAVRCADFPPFGISPEAVNGFTQVCSLLSFGVLIFAVVFMLRIKPETKINDK